MGLDPDGPQAAYESLHLAGLLGTECRQAARCMPATEGLPQRSAGEDRTDEGLMEPTLGGSLRGSPGGRLLRCIEPSQVLPGAGTQVTGHSLGERQAPPGRAGRPKQACGGLSPAALSGSREVLASTSHLPQGLPGRGGAGPAVRGALPRVSCVPAAAGHVSHRCLSLRTWSRDRWAAGRGSRGAELGAWEP